MKLRSDYVSNSSSSSFVIALDKPIQEYTLGEFVQLFRVGRAFDELMQHIKSSPTEISCNGKHVYDVHLVGGCHNVHIDDILKSEQLWNWKIDEPCYDESENNKLSGPTCLQSFTDLNK